MKLLALAAVIWQCSVSLVFSPAWAGEWSRQKGEGAHPHLYVDRLGSIALKGGKEDADSLERRYFLKRHGRQDDGVEQHAVRVVLAQDEPRHLWP